MAFPHDGTYRASRMGRAGVPVSALAVACTHPPGRSFPDPLVREMLRACGIVTCPDCGQALRILGRRHR
jgi:hypothetical protein